MPCGVPYTDKQRMSIHQALYGNTNIPSIRKSNIIAQNTDNSSMYIIGGIVASAFLIYLISKK